MIFLKLPNIGRILVTDCGGIFLVTIKGFPEVTWCETESTVIWKCSPGERSVRTYSVSAMGSSVAVVQPPRVSSPFRGYGRYLSSLFALINDPLFTHQHNSCFLVFAIKTYGTYLTVYPEYKEFNGFSHLSVSLLS